MRADDRGLMDAVVQVSFAVTAVLTRVANHHDLSLTTLRVLAILRDREPTMAELATHLGLDRSTVSGLVDRAAARGLLERTANLDDRRSSRVRLTDDGRALALHGTEEVAAEVSLLTARLEPAQRAEARHLLEAMLP